MITPFDGDIVEPHYPTVVDIETAPDGTTIAVGFAWSTNAGKREYYAFETISDWYDYYKSLMLYYRHDKEASKRLSRVYAHNGANFDYLSFYSELYDIDALERGQYFTADSAGIGFKAKLKGIKREVTFLDSYRMLPASLAKLTKDFKVEYEKQIVPEECKHDYARFKSLYSNEFWSYLQADCMGLQEVLFTFWRQVVTLFGNVGYLPMTLPALVMRVFSKQIKEDIYTPSNAKLKQLERDAYKGGLTLCMRTGIFDNVNVYDVNSMYPAVMVAERYPASYVGYWSNEYDKTQMGLWRASFRQSRQDVPPVLFDNEKGASYSGSGVYTTNELNYLENIGGEFTISEGYIYTKTDTLFTEFIGSIYAIRRDAIERGDDALGYTLKIMMNSLYGKFAQREETEKIVLGSAKLLKQLIDTETPFKIMGNFFVIKEQTEVKHAFVSIAAMITANARILLHKLMTGVIDNGNELYYCDTDSIHTNGALPVSNDLGRVKLEMSGTVAYAGRKLYAFKDGKVKAKGIGRLVTKGDLSYSTLSRLATEAMATEAITFSTFPSVKGVLSLKQRAAVLRSMTRNIRNTGGIWDDDKTK